MARLVLLIVALLGLCTSGAWAQKESRVALVIGNGAYQNADSLRNPVNDARAMAKALGDAGFEVILNENATRRSLTNSLREFSSKLVPGGVGVFYYAGHGMQVRGANYLIPTDAALNNEDELRYETIDVNDVLSRFDDARTRLTLVILDACRDNPFARRFRSTGRGLAQTDAPRGTVIAYATAPGETAADGDGDNGLYTAELLKALVMPGLKLEEVFKRTIDGVARVSRNKQTPWVSSSFRGEFYFHGAAAAGSPPAAAPGSAASPDAPQPSQPSSEQLELAAWNAIATSNNAAMFEVFLRRFPNGVYADFARARLEELKAAETRVAAADAARGKAAPDDAKGKAAADEAKAKAAADEARRKADEEAKRKADAERQKAAPVPAPAPPQQAAAPAPPPQPAAPGAPRFDGAWVAHLTCEPSKNAAGYNYQFTMNVRGGEITGNYAGVSGNNMSFRGRIGPTGSATITVEGTTGNPKYSLDNVAPGSHVSFQLASQFADGSGRGTRTSGRPCVITMTKR